MKTILNPDNVTMLDAKDLMSLLEESDYHSVVRQEQDVISDHDLDKLLDRSDLWARWAKAKDAEKGMCKMQTELPFKTFLNALPEISQLAMGWGGTATK